MQFVALLCELLYNNAHKVVQMSRIARQSCILNIINSQEIETQEELVEQLRLSSFDVTQATISRDIKDLNLIKTLSSSGKYRYVALQDANNTISAKVLNIFKETAISITVALNQVIVKTMAGCASIVASIVDQLKISQILGTVSGNDTLLIVAIDENNSKIIAGQLTNLLYGKR